MSDLDRRLADLALSQHGAFSLAQARQAGATDNVIRTRRAQGRWITIHPGVCCMAGTPPTILRDLSAATLARPGSIISHLSAARFHRVGSLPDGLLTLSGSPTHRRLAGVQLRRRSDLDRCAIVVIDGLPVTDLATTVFDLADVVGARRYERIVDDQLSAHRVSIEDLVVAFERHACRGRNGTARAREVLSTRAAGQVVSQSDLEQRFRRTVVPSLVMKPAYQFLPPWRTDGIGRVDVAFPSHRLIVELDGRRWHSRDAQWEEDHRRDQEALVNGWRTLRFTYRQVRDEPRMVASTTNNVLVLCANSAL